jgi:putative ABC transport system permease protein
MISESGARKAFPGESAVGQTIVFEEYGGPGVLEVVGVVADVKAAGIEADAPPTVYLPYWSIMLGTASYVVRASGDPAGLIATIRSLAASVARDVPIYRIQNLSEIVEGSVASRRLHTCLAGGFASAGVLLTCFGVFGMVSYSVARRTGEIGVRIALGATRSRVMRMMIRESLRPVLLGLMCGVLAALAFGQLLASQLYGVGPNDPSVLATVAGLIGAAAVGAAYWPARRASRIEPVEALRWE